MVYFTVEIKTYYVVNLCNCNWGSVTHERTKNHHTSGIPLKDTTRRYLDNKISIIALRITFAFRILFHIKYTLIMRLLNIRYVLEQGPNPNPNPNAVTLSHNTNWQWVEKRLCVQNVKTVLFSAIDIAINLPNWKMSYIIMEEEICSYIETLGCIRNLVENVIRWAHSSVLNGRECDRIYTIKYCSVNMADNSVADRNLDFIIHVT